MRPYHAEPPIEDDDDDENEYDWPRASRRLQTGTRGEAYPRF
jgi:hypothetical protein